MEEKNRSREPMHVGPADPMIRSRAKILLTVAGILSALLLLRILIYQTAGYEHYQKKVLEQITTEAEVNAERGCIYDRNGVLLATNITTYRVFISPSAISAAQVEHNKAGDGVDLAAIISQGLFDTLGVSSDFVREQIAKTRYLDRTIKKQVDEDTAAGVRELIDRYGLHQMIYLESTPTRYYPYATLASHVLGFTGSDGTGLYGLEYSYNNMLAGTNGRYITARDAQGNEMPYAYKEYIPAGDGYNIKTTLDVFVQSALEEQLKNAYNDWNGANRAAGIVMDVNTGEVLGMGVYPPFDLNNPRVLDSQSKETLESSGHETESEEYSKLYQELLMRMWSNKAITEAYIPGSTFKVMTAAMALEEAVVTPTEAFTCQGFKEVLGQKIHCHKTKGHGALTFVQGIQQSCNPVLMTVVLRIGKGTFYDYIKSFGYLEKTGIDLPGEGSGLFISEDRFTDLDLAIYAFGQNFNVTLIQQITAVSAVANGGYLVTPHLVSSVTDRDGSIIKSYDSNIRRQVVSTEVCRTVSDILEKGVSGDGGAKNAYVVGYRVAAKTGTSEKKDAGNIDEYICSTVAYAPADNPQYAVIIIVDEPNPSSGAQPYGSTVAAPYVGKVLETILPYLGVEAVYTDEELEKKTVTIPRCINWSANYATKICTGKTYGLEVEIVGDPNGVVCRQYPEAGTVVEKGAGRIILYTERGSETADTVVPNVIGMSPVAANQALINAGLNIRVEGTKNYTGLGIKVSEQSISPGTVVPKGTVVVITFPYTESED